MSGSPMARQLAPGVFMLCSGRPACGPVSLLAQEAGRFYRRFPPALLFGERPQDLFRLVLFRKRTHVQKGVKNESFDPDDKGARIGVPERKDLRSNINFFRKCRFQLKRRLSHFRVRFFHLNRGLNRLFQINRRPIALSSSKNHTQSERREFVGHQPEQSVRLTIPFPFGLVSAVPRTMIFHLKSATKLGPQMVYELNEKSTI
jgi:hypothetical protein